MIPEPVPQAHRELGPVAGRVYSVLMTDGEEVELTWPHVAALIKAKGWTKARFLTECRRTRPLTGGGLLMPGALRLWAGGLPLQDWERAIISETFARFALAPVKAGVVGVYLKGDSLER